MSKYSIRDADGKEINTIVCSASDIAAFTPENGEAVLLSAIDRPLATLKAEAQSKLMAAIEGVRASLVTNLSGQEMIYLRKETEAKAVVVDASPDPLNYPILASEVGYTAPSLYEVAQIVLYKSAMWQHVGAFLERYRYEVTDKISNTTEDTIEAVLSRDFASEIHSALTYGKSDHV